MARKPLPSTIEDQWPTEEFAPVTARRNGKVAIAKEVRVPFKAILSENGILSWEWTTPTVERKRGKGTIRSTTALQPRKVSAHLWRDFLQLANADDERFVAFAERWGRLQEVSVAAEHGSERLDRWRFFARLARAIRDCSVAMAQAKPGAARDWEQICKWLGRDCDPKLAKVSEGKPCGSAILYRRSLISSALNRWYGSSPGNILIGWRRDYKMVIEPAVTSLFGIIGIQLAYAIVGATEMLVCHHCSRFFTPPRQPPTGQRVFCPKCRKAAKPQLYAMRDYRSRNKPV